MATQIQTPQDSSEFNNLQGSISTAVNARSSLKNSQENTSLASSEHITTPLPPDFDLSDAHDPETEALRDHPSLAPQYHIVRLLGRGSQGTVWLARTESDTYVAIKALLLNELLEWKSTELFMREIETLKSMNVQGTPRYLDAIDASQAQPPYYFLVQTLITGQTLEDMLNSGYTFTPEDISAIALAVLPILTQLRSFVPPVVHRDIKPSNLMASHNGYINLIDFGTSMLHEKSLGGTTVAGTAGYMAPEQCLGSSCPESDIYSLGATLVHLLTGVPPWQMTLSSDMKLLFKSYVPLNTSPHLIQLLEAMLDPIPSRRLSNLSKLMRMLQESDEATHTTRFKFITSSIDKTQTPQTTQTKAVIPSYKFNIPGFDQPVFAKSWVIHVAFLVGIFILIPWFAKTKLPTNVIFTISASILIINLVIYYIFSHYQRVQNKALFEKLRQIQQWKEEKKRINK